MKNAQIRFYIFSLVVTLFLGICFTSADFLTIPVTTVKDFLIIGAQWMIVAIALYFVSLLLAANKYVFAIVFPTLTFISALLAWFRLTMNATLTPMILDAALENDFRTSGDMISLGLLFFVAGTLFLSLALVYYRYRRIIVRRSFYPACIGIVFLFAITQVNALKRPISERIPFTLYYTFMKYWEEKQVINEKRIDLTEGIRCGDEDVTVVFVLGESLRPDHLGVNGYRRNTTPFLSKEDIISFPHIYTEQAYTNRSVPHILTRADSTDFSRAYTEKSFVSMFKACDFYTVWLANQEAADTYVYFMNECDSLFHINIEKSSYVFDKWVDGDLFPLFDNALKVNKNKKLIILHTIGSHWWYNSHFTDEFACFQPVVKSKVISSCTKEEMINSYDNTVLYTDYFLHGLINRLRNKNAILIYQSDHGEALGEDGVWLHAAETSYTHMAACMVWMSPIYKENHFKSYERVKDNSLKRFRTDYLYHSILDAADIGSEYLDESLSIFR